ncbi:MAG: hypothetical protein JSW64_16120, partial [Candidatus Zixiibacteriota bacterium]
MISAFRYLVLCAMILNFINSGVTGEMSSQINSKFNFDRDSFIDPYDFLLNLNENSYDYKFANCEDHVDDVYWDNRFTLPGINGTIWTMALDGNDIYIGGEFTFAGKERVNNIAVLNTINGEWSALGEGITKISPLDDSDPIVYAVEILNGAVYVAGCFKKADDINVNNIACWNGQEWNNVGDGVTSNPNPQSAVIRALSSDGANLFAGGSFNFAGTTSVANLARWDGAGWHDVGGGVTGNGWPEVMTLECDGTNLYVGGGFNSAGGIEANRIAMWDGANWHTFGIMKGFLTSSFVHSIEKYG